MQFIIISTIAIAVFSFIGLYLVVESSGRHQKRMDSLKSIYKDTK